MIDDIEQRFKEVRDRLEAPPAEVWKAEPGESKTLIVTDVGFRPDTYADGDYPIITGQDQEGKLWTLHCFDTVAKNEVAKLKPQPGDIFGAKYFGLVERAGGQPYKSWKITTDRPAAAKWDQVETEPEHDDESVTG